MTYTVVGFDYGGVIYGPTGVTFLEEVAKFLDVPAPQLREIFFKNNHRVNVHREMDWTGLWEHIAVESGHAKKKSGIAPLIEEWENKKQVDQEVIALIAILRSSGYRVGLLSNYADGLRKLLETQGIADHFDFIGISSELGCMKPNPAVFHKFCEAMKISPSELIFIDDTKKSLETAEAVGYTPILYRGFEGLKKDLVRLGVLEEQE